jgi:hypothetical protein
MTFKHQGKRCAHSFAVGVLFCFLLFCLFPSVVWAADALDLQVYPPVAYLSVKPGAGINHQLTLKNNGLYTLEITPVLVNFHTDQQTGQVVLEQKSDFNHLNLEGDPSAWQKSFVLKPGEEKLLNFVLTLPSDAPYAEHRLSILFQAQQLSFASAAKQGSVISAIVASNVVVLVAADEINRGELVIEQLSLPKFADSFVGFSFSALVRNIGSNATPISGYFKVSHWPETTPTIYELYPDMVLANDKRLVRAMTEAELKELTALEESKAVLEAAGEDFTAKKNELIRQQLRSEFYFKQAVMIGAYDVELKVGDSLLQKRVVVLPFSVLLIALLLPPLYWLTKWLGRALKKK